MRYLASIALTRGFVTVSGLDTYFIKLSSEDFNKNSSILVTEETMVSVLRREASKVLRSHENSIILLYDGQQLQDDRQLRFYNLNERSAPIDVRLGRGLSC